VPVFCFTIDGVAVPAIVKALDDQGVAVRGGDMAALPLLERFASRAAARVSAYLYNTVEDIDRVGVVLSKLSR
jgi:cysteine desulfurase/selenocysteine lyase